MRSMIILAAAVSLAACNADEKGAPGAGTETLEKPQRSGECPVIASRDWSARIDAEQDPDEPRLIVRGVIDLPTPGWGALLRETFADRAMPPGVHFTIDFTEPDGMVAQVVTPRHITHVSKAYAHGYRSITVHCGDEVLAEIFDIPGSPNPIN